MDGTSRHVALQTCLHFLQNRATVRVFAESHDCEEHGLFEGTEVISHLTLPTLYYTNLAARPLTPGSCAIRRHDECARTVAPGTSRLPANVLVSALGLVT